MVTYVNESIVQRHAEDAAFLWLLRERAVGGSHYSHAQLRSLDERVDAHLDGLRVAGVNGWSRCVEELREWAEPGEVFAAAYLAWCGDDPARHSSVLDTVGQEPELEAAVVAAASWHRVASVRPTLELWLTGASPARRRIGLKGLAAHRQELGHALLDGLTSADERMRVASIVTAGALGRTDAIGPLRELLGATDSVERLAAARSLARLGCDDARTASTLLLFAEAQGEPCVTAIQALVRSRPRRGLEHFDRWRRQEHGIRRAIEAAAVLGDPSTVPFLIDCMHDEQLARRSGHALSTITGLDLEYEDLDRSHPAERSRGASDDPDDECVELDPDHELPWPSVFAIAHWWRQQADRFQPGVRYLQGSPIGSTGETASGDTDYANLLALAQTGRPLVRTLAALELAHRVPARPRLETRAPMGRGHRLPGLPAWPVIVPGEPGSIEKRRSA